MQLDTNTIVFMSTLMAGALSIVLFSGHRSFPPEVRGLREWALGLFVLMLAGIVLSLGRLVPEPLMLFAANSAMVWGSGLTLIGTQKFYARRPSWWLLMSLWAAGMVCLVGWYLVTQDFALRVAVFSFLVCVVYAYQLVLIVRCGERHSSTAFFGVLMLVQSLVLLARGLVAAYGKAGTDLAHAGPFQGIYLATTSFMTLMLTVGFLVVATRRLQTVLELRSNLDPLTGALNRRGFSDAFARETASMRRHAQPMTVLSIDLDFFKSINDRYGHAEGDRVLVRAAQIGRQVLREIDYLARFGGEEFVVLLPQTAPERAQAVAERLLQQFRLPHGDGLPVCTVSIGIASRVDPDEQMDALLSRADVALYRAKGAGRNRVEVCQQPLVRLSKAA